MVSDWSGIADRLALVAVSRAVDRFADAWRDGFDALEVLHREGGSLAALALLSALREDLDAIVVPDLVRGARGQEVSWADIGEALGVSRQAARAKFRAAVEGEG